MRLGTAGLWTGVGSWKHYGRPWSRAGRPQHSLQEGQERGHSKKSHLETEGRSSWWRGSARRLQKPQKRWKLGRDCRQADPSGCRLSLQLPICRFRESKMAAAGISDDFLLPWLELQADRFCNFTFFLKHLQYLICEPIFHPISETES